MSFATASTRAASADLVNRRLVSALLLSLLFHAMLLALQFGVPGLGLPTPFKPPSISIRIVPAEPALSAVAAAPVEALPPAPAQSGMRLIAPMPAAPVVVAKAKPVKRRRISRPLPPREPVEAPTAVIAQDQNPNDSFVVPLPQPKEAEQKTADPTEAQEGADDGAALRAAQVAEDKRQEELAAAATAQLKAEQEAQLLAKQAEERKAQEQQRRLDEDLAQRRLAEDEDRRQAALRQRQLDERAARQQAELVAARARAEELALEQQRKQQADQVTMRQKADELALKQKTEELALKQKAEELARQQAAEVARQQAEQAARQQAEQAAATAATQRQRDQAAASAGAGNLPAGAGGAGATVAKNLLGSDAGNRVRELTRGIDLLGGTPPPRPRGDAERSGRRVVVGVAERDIPLSMYADSFRQKIERNGGLAFSPMAAERVRIDPLVSVAIRSDGSVEEVTIVRSSGHAETDNAVRRIVRLNARYSSFPPNVASRYDVIEIRRIWSFAETLKLMEELH